MRRRLTALWCFVVGHTSGGHSTARNFDRLGRPRQDGTFTIDAWCIHCGAYTGVTVPDLIRIYPEEG